jgi:protoheme IX farnesyltransferase
MNVEAEVLEQSQLRTRSRVLDYAELMKPELTFLSVLSALCGFYLGTTGQFNFWLFFHVATGTTLLGGGAGTLNQYIERTYDGMMKRTERRPLPAGRLYPLEVLIFGIVISVAGLVQLTLFTNVLTGFLGALTFTTYIFLYTPLKRITPWSTIVGAIPGALPPMIGWAAVRNDLPLEAWILFAILFFWQMPHFLSLAWMYRKDYARANYKILTVFDATGVRTGKQIVIFLFALIPATMITSFIGMTGKTYFMSALLLNGVFLFFGLRMMKCTGDHITEDTAKLTSSARRLFFASLIYLPALMLLMALDKA